MQRYQSIDLLKVVLIFFVVATHSSFLYDYSYAFGHVMGNGLVRLVVPLFLIISGYFSVLGDRINKTISWLKRILVLYIFWMSVYLPYWIDFDEFNPFRSLIDSIFGFYHLWFVSALLGGGVMLYSFRRLSNRNLLVLALILFLTGVFIEYAGEYHLFLSISPIIDWLFSLNFAHRNFFFIGFPFLTIGYLIRKTNLKQKLKKKTLFVLFLISALFFALESVILYFKLSGEYRGYDVYLMSFFLCPLIFLIVLNSNSRFSKLETKTISLYSAAIYFIHPVFVINYTQYLKLDSITLTLVTLLSSVIASYFIIQLHRRFKYIL